MFNPFKLPTTEEMRPEDVIAEPELSEVLGPVSGQPQNWILIVKSYAPPVKQIPENLQDSSLVEKLMFGVTTLLLQDVNSGQIRKEEIIGSDENQLFFLLDKSKQFGLQYINYNGDRFAIALVPQGETLPIK